MYSDFFRSGLASGAKLAGFAASCYEPRITASCYPSSSAAAAAPVAMAFAPAEGAKKETSTARSVKMLMAGGFAGAVARTCTAPLDRIKLLFQVQALGQGGTSSTKYTGVGQALLKIYQEEGVLAYWKGNGVNIIRIFPYSAAQFMSHEQYKSMLALEDGTLTVPRRLCAGALAGMTGTALTHPLDTLRLRLAMPDSGYKGMVDAGMSIMRTEGPFALYKGIGATLVGIAPYAACNFASYDLFKKWTYGSGLVKEGIVSNLLIGAAAGTVATTACYPLDTVRRRMQMKGKIYDGVGHALRTIVKEEGFLALYKGWWANTLKVVPQNAIRFVSYEFFKKLFRVVKQKTDT